MINSVFPLVSVIVTTKNEEKNIANCLKSILKQAYKNIEIIVVDNNSTDKTKEIVDDFFYPKISFFTQGPERSSQRNFGVSKAKGEYILYLDADMILSKDVIKDCVTKIQNNPNIIALYISEIVMGESFWCKVRRFERSFYDGTVIDCVRFISKKAFDAVKGFDENMSGPEDWDFDKKIRLIGKTDLVKTPIYHNENNFNLLQYLNKKSYYIKSFDTYIKKWGKDDADIKKQLRVYYRYFGVFIENGKWKKMLFHPILICGMFFLRIVVGINYLLSKRKD
jgi:glycosyltransferase involved in cell wall biosynthesis